MEKAVLNQFNGIKVAHPKYYDKVFDDYIITHTGEVFKINYNYYTTLLDESEPFTRISTRARQHSEHQCLTLSKDGASQNLFLHLLMAHTFIATPNEFARSMAKDIVGKDAWEVMSEFQKDHLAEQIGGGLQVDHVNDDPTYNHIDNLQYLNGRANARKGAEKTQDLHAKVTDDELRELVEQGLNATQIAEKLGMSGSRISSRLNNIGLGTGNSLDIETRRKIIKGIENGKTDHEIGLQLGMDRKKIYSYRRKYNQNK